MFSNNSTDVNGGLLPLFVLYSQIMIMNSALLKGAKLILYPKLNRKTLVKAVFQDKITSIAGSPNLFQMLLEKIWPYLFISSINSLLIMFLDMMLII